MQVSRVLAPITLMALCSCSQPESKTDTSASATKNDLQNVLNQRTQEAYKLGYEAGRRKGFEEGFSHGMVKSFTDTSNIRIHKNELKRLVAEIIYSHNSSSQPKPIPEKVLSRKFEAYAILNTEEPEAAYRYVRAEAKNKYRLSEYEFYNYFGVTDTLRLADGNTMLVVLYGITGFEYIPFVFAVFKIVGDKFVLEGLLDELNGASIGGLKIEEIIPLSDGSYLLRGLTRGGDGGDVWAELWFSHWRKPFHLKKLFSQSYKAYSENNQKEFGYSFDRESLKAEVLIKERKVLSRGNEGRQYSEWSVIERDSVDLNALITK